MRMVRWLFIVSSALFVFGVGFVVVAARSARHVSEAAVERPVVVALASVKQITTGIVGPASNVIFNSVSTTLTEKGTEDVAPRNDEEWTTVRNSAAALAESGNLMTLEGRAVESWRLDDERA